jgi:RNA polymerase sigma-70 factor (ECF subfamily)
VPGPRVDSLVALGYIEPERAAPLESPEFDYEVLVRPLEGRMMRSIWRIVRDREAAEDALQDALAAIWKKRRAVARHPKPEALILRIAVCAAHDAMRRSRRRLGHETAGLSEGAAASAAPPVTQALEDLDLRRSILDAVGRLPRRQAEAVLLRFVEERSYEDIATAMGCAESTARVHAVRGRERLARRLSREIPGLGPAAMTLGTEETKKGEAR